jgi:hypothetical protein
VHNARCVHGSRPNDSDVSRPLLLSTFTAASARMLPFGECVAIGNQATWERKPGALGNLTNNLRQIIHVCSMQSCVRRARLIYSLCLF